MLILLDIDGVLVPANSWRKPEFHADGFPMFNSRSAQALQRILTETNASVLLTTSHKTKYTAAEWRGMLRSRGITPKKLNRLNTNTLLTSRKDEILEWYMKKHVDEEFVIIDDDKMLNDLPENIKANLVLTSSSVGLTDDLANDAISILRKQALHVA